MDNSTRKELIYAVGNLMNVLGSGRSIDEQKIATLSNEELATGVKTIAECINKGIDFSKNPTKAEFNRLINEINENGLWEQIPFVFGIASDADTHWSQKAYAKCKAKIPKDRLWDTLMSIYVREGFDFPVKWITEAIPYRPNDYLDDLPARYKNAEKITVYRASTLSPALFADARYELSWTINPHIAREFYRIRFSWGQRCSFFKAEINKDDIIAFVSPDMQDEVLQYCGVQKIQWISEFAFEKECQRYDRMTKVQKKGGEKK